MNGNNLFLTNILLTIIAALLLVTVIQNGVGSRGQTSRPAIPMDSYHRSMPSQASEDRNPTVNPQAQNMAGTMYFMAMTAFPEGCSGMRTLNECESPAAKKVRDQVSAWAESGKRPREVFDLIVKTYGEDALTDQAKAIRNMRVKGQ